MTTLSSFINKIKDTPESIEFDDVIQVINNHYLYSPICFHNGIENDCIINQAGENEGSCKIFSFAQRHQLSQEQTLHCFGKYYRDDVLNNPENTDHANIRTFMKYGWDYIKFDGNALNEK